MTGKGQFLFIYGHFFNVRFFYFPVLRFLSNF